MQTYTHHIHTLYLSVYILEDQGKPTYINCKKGKDPTHFAHMHSACK
uniref:Uncharacterized protein n=1 Tax=Anguilla anguilla TaxID=7936 RepID=A0A0E9PF62_ANGAN